MRDWKMMAAAAVSVLALAEAANAQTPQPASAQPAEGRQAFEPAFFARFNPVTALDMVRQVPGFTIDEGEDLRGFGATAGNVLIDGQRPATKTSLSDELGRIAARDIARIELIRASAAGDIDVRGYTELANVVLKSESKMQVSTTFAATTRWYEQGRQGVQLGGTRSWKTDDFGFRLATQLTSLGEREEVASLSRNAAGAPTLRQEEFYQQQAGELLITGALNWTPTARDTYNVNFRVLPRLLTLNAAADVRLASGTPLGGIFLDYEEKDIWYVDLGGDWEHKFNSANSTKVSLINRLVNWRPQQLLTQAVTGLPQGRVRDNSDNNAGEHVLRGTWTTRPSAEHTVEFGLEGAYNYREVARQRLVGGLTGALFPTAVPFAASTKVEEERVEASITDVWRMSPQLTLEAGFNFEASTITQSGSVSNERDFTYSKPRLVATWAPAKEDQFRFSIVRDVSQLDFADFATGLDTISNTAPVGNPNLRPEQTWKASAQWKHQIGQRGSISLTGFYDDIEDTQDYIALTAPTAVCQLNGQTQPNTRTCNAIGNVGDGTRFGGRIEATLPLDGVGVKGGILRLNAGAQDSTVTDPLTGVEREISNETEYDWTVDFRQDVPTMKFAWGGKIASTLPVSSTASVAAPPTSIYRVDRIEAVEQGDVALDLFVETTRYLGGMLVRLTAANLLDAERDVNRRLFVVDPDFTTAPNIPPRSVFAGTEDRASSFGRTVTLTVAAAF